MKNDYAGLARIASVNEAHSNESCIFGGINMELRGFGDARWRCNPMKPPVEVPPAKRPRASPAQILARAAVKVYRLILSPLIGWNCRHLPTCSQYADEAFARHGFWAGGWMTLARVLRCQPFGTSGLDFVADTLPAQARWYLPWRYGRWRGTNTVPPRN
jgi:putative membrane protein insertion efficiency factor